MCLLPFSFEPQSPPIIVKLVEPPKDPTGIAHVVVGALGLTGVITVIAIVLGVVLAGVMFWLRRAVDYPALACGRSRGLRFIPDSARRKIALSMTAQLLLYLAAAASIALGYTAALYFWFLPALLAQPFLRVLLIAEHTGCSLDANGLTNTRTTLAGWPIRF